MLYLCLLFSTTPETHHRLRVSTGHHISLTPRYDGAALVGVTLNLLPPIACCRSIYTACYVRVSTEEQNSERQLESVQSYAQDALDTELADLQIFRDKSTGTDTSRSGYREIMTTVEESEVDHLVAHEISRLARSLQDFERTVSRITDNGAAIHFVRDGLSFGDGKERPMHRLQMQMLGAFAEWQARVKQMNTKEGIAARQQEDGYHHGRPPLGFEKDDGRLIEGENYDQVRAVLDMVRRVRVIEEEGSKKIRFIKSNYFTSYKSREVILALKRHFLM